MPSGDTPESTASHHHRCDLVSANLVLFHQLEWLSKHA
jgi:hypothetical protein